MQTIEYENGYRADHSPVVLHIKTTDFVQGRGYLKFNNSLLSDKKYIHTIKTLIIDTKIQYAALFYNINEIQNIKDSEIVFQNIRKPIFQYIIYGNKREIYLFQHIQKKKKRKLKEEGKNNLKMRLKTQNIFYMSSKQILADKQTEFENLRACT